MKKYLVFAGDKYYPSGGWQDFIGGDDTLTDALRRVAEATCDWWQVVDTDVMAIIERGQR